MRRHGAWSANQQTSKPADSEPQMACHSPDKEKAILESENGLLEHFLGVHPLNGFPGQKWLATARTRKKRF